MKLSKWSGIAALALLSTQAQAQAIISNGTIKLGVNRGGILNVVGDVRTSTRNTVVGLRLVTPSGEYGSTFGGCLCEGWGVGVASGAGAGISGYENFGVGAGGISFVSFTSTATSAKSVMRVRGALEVTHEYVPSSQPNLYEAKVSIRNITNGTLGDATTGIVYRRVMDWDIDPSPWYEQVKLQGWPSNMLWRSSNDGFASADPLTGLVSYEMQCTRLDNVNISTSAACDQGVLFDFKFGALGAGKSANFSLFYGAATTETVLMNALSVEGVEGYSVASCLAGFAPGACPAIFGLGFKKTIAAVPEPASLALIGTGLLGLFAARRRRSQ